MVKVADLPKGWTLWADPDNANPWFRNRDGLHRTHYEVASTPEGPQVFREVKRVLDEMDLEWKKPGAELRFKAADRAKLSLQVALGIVGKWHDGLLENETRGRYLEAASYRGMNAAGRY